MRFTSFARLGVLRQRNVILFAYVPLLCIAIIVASAIVTTNHQTKVTEARQAQALKALAAQQKAQAARQKVAAQSDVINETFADLSTAAENKSDCERLKNRPGVIITTPACDYKLLALGDIQVAVVFVNEYAYSTYTYNNLKDTNSNNPSSLAYVNTYFANQAARYKVKNPAKLKFTYFGPYKVTDSVINKYYFDNGYDLINTYQNTAKANNVPVKNYDIVNYVLLDSVYGGVAFPGQHQAFSYSVAQPGTFAHETLHLFGASDKYSGRNDPSCKSNAKADPFDRYSGAVAGDDIMCNNFSISTSIINDITAREIGWAN